MYHYNRESNQIEWCEKHRWNQKLEGYTDALRSMDGITITGRRLSTTPDGQGDYPQHQMIGENC